MPCGTLRAVPALEHVKELIETALPGSEVEIADFAGGGGDHLTATVSAPQFAGLSLLEQHRLVYAAVEREFGSGAIHALSIKTTVKES
jgi:stress-induced morphogen